MSAALPRYALDVGPSRLRSMAPRDFRVAAYPDGSKRIQGAYAWSQGKDGGVEWRDLPLVNVNAAGEEIHDGG